MRFLNQVVSQVAGSNEALGAFRITNPMVIGPRKAVPTIVTLPQPSCWPVPDPPAFYMCPNGQPMRYGPSAADGRNCAYCDSGVPMGCSTNPSTLRCAPGTTPVSHGQYACCEPNATGLYGSLGSLGGGAVGPVQSTATGLGANVSPKTGLPCSVPRVKKVNGVAKEFCWYTDLGEIECPGCVKNPMLLRK